MYNFDNPNHFDFIWNIESDYESKESNKFFSTETYSITINKYNVKCSTKLYKYIINWPHLNPQLHPPVFTTPRPLTQHNRQRHIIITADRVRQPSPYPSSQSSPPASVDLVLPLSTSSRTTKLRTCPSRRSSNLSWSIRSASPLRWNPLARKTRRTRTSSRW